MTREDLLDRLRAGTGQQWHWWAWHFGVHGDRGRVPLVDALLDALLSIDAAMPGYAARMADTIISISGRTRDTRDYEQLLQVLAEIHVAAHIVSADWPEGTSFADEPTAGDSAKTPELVVTTSELRLGVEVKAPALLDHAAKRGSRPMQAGGRIFPPAALEKMAGGKDKLTLPRDNPVKDFLASANDKFASFRERDDDFHGLLVIVWDDFIYEPITALLHAGSGLLTDNSFAKKDDQAVQYPNVDAIVLLSHLQWLQRALAEDGTRQAPFQIGGDAFAWGPDPARPAALVIPPAGRGLPDDLVKRLGLQPLETIPGAEYQPSDFVNWIDRSDVTDAEAPANNAGEGGET